MSESNESPVTLIHNLSNGYKLSQALYAVAKLGVADQFGDGRRGIAATAREI